MFSPTPAGRFCWRNTSKWLILALALALAAGCGSGADPPPAGAIPTPTAAILGASSASPSEVPRIISPAPESTPSPAPAPTAAAAPAAPQLGSPTATPVMPATPSAEPGGVAASGEAGPERPSEMPNSIPPAPAESAVPVVPIAEAVKTPPVGERRTWVIALDPGHGGPESGASAVGLAEKNVNLKIALELADLLRDRGFGVVLTRETDRAVSPEFTGGSYPGVVKDLQARVDIANSASADLFISIHNNGSGDPDQKGTEVWYNNQRSFAERNLALARLVQEGLLERIRALGYPGFDRGIKDDSNFRIFRGQPYNLYVLGPGSGARPHVPTQMPGVLGESLFLSNAADAAMLRQERTLNAIAAGYRDAVVAYFELYPD